MPISFGGKPVPGTRGATVKPADMPQRNAIARRVEQQAALAELPAGAAEVLLFVRMLALTFEARRRLRLAVDALREIDLDALNDPALADHPRRPAMVHEYEARKEAERLAAHRGLRLAGVIDTDPP